MKVIFDIDGWRKEGDVSKDAMIYGSVLIPLEPPLSILTDEAVYPEGPVVVRVPFRYYGEREKGVKIFRYKREDE